MDYSQLTNAITLQGVGPAVLTAAGALVALYVIILGVRQVMAMVEGQRVKEQQSADELQLHDERQAQLARDTSGWTDKDWDEMAYAAEEADMRARGFVDDRTEPPED